MKTILFSLVFVFFISSTLYSQHSIDWQKSFGGTTIDEPTEIVPTTDGGFLLIGSTNSQNGDVNLPQGQSDGWVVKISSKGAIEWEKTFGGVLNDSLRSIRVTPDGYFVLVGSTESTTIDSNNHKGMFDIWVVKIKGNGDILWQKTFGGSGIDIGKSIEVTSDSGYVVAGFTNSTNGDITNSRGSTDFWVLKLSTNGTLEWEKTYGGSGIDEAFSLKKYS